jgi:hypothetical protein
MIKYTIAKVLHTMYYIVLHKVLHAKVLQMFEFRIIFIIFNKNI